MIPYDKGDLFFEENETEDLQILDNINIQGSDSSGKNERLFSDS